MCVLQEGGPAGAETAAEEWEQAIPGPDLQGPGGPRDAGQEVRDRHAGMCVISSV